MQEAEVIAFMERVDEQLPVHLFVVHVAIVEVVAIEFPRREIGTHSVEPRLDVEARRAVGGRCRQHPHHAVFLGERQRREAWTLGPDAREGGRLLGKAAQHAVVAVGPAVIGARERARAAATLGHLGAAMPAYVEEGTQLPVAAPDGQDWNAREIVGPVGAGLRPVAGEPHHYGSPPDENLLLPLVALRAGVGAHLVVPWRVGHRGRLRVDVVHQLLEEGYLSRSVHDRSSSRMADRQF